MTDTPRGPTTEELRARALAHHSAIPGSSRAPYACPECGATQPVPGRCGRCPGTTRRTALRLPRPCLACNREQGERMCDLCQRLEVAEASAER